MVEPTNDAGLAEVCPQKTGINHCAQGKEPCGSDETEILVPGGADDSTHRGSKSKTSYGTLHLETQGRQPTRVRSQLDVNFLSNAMRPS
ncbi:hypothetical protein EMCRGX_G031168 [Ephydatia muelleri]